MNNDSNALEDAYSQQPPLLSKDSFHIDDID